MNKQHNPRGTSTKSAASIKPHARHAGQPAAAPRAERPSLAGERAEGEGMVAPAPESVKAATELEGEGSYTAGRRYDEGVRASVKKGDAEKLGEEAAKALDGPEGAGLKKAEQAAKHGHAA